MNRKESLAFVTNIPSPYNLDLFEALSKLFNLEVYYYDDIEQDREWKIEINSDKYFSKVFIKDFSSRLLKLIYPKFYWNTECLKLALFSKCSNFIISGNYFVPNTLFLLIILRVRNKKVYWFGERLLPTNNWIKKIFKKIFITPINLCTDGIFAVGVSAINSYRQFGYKKIIINTPY